MRSALLRVTLMTLPALLLLWWVGPAWAGFWLGWAGLVYALTGVESGIEAEKRADWQRQTVKTELLALQDSFDRALLDLRDRVDGIEGQTRPRS